MPVRFGIVKGFVECAIKVCSDLEARDQELSHISETMQLSSYPLKFAEKAIKQVYQIVKQDDRKKKDVGKNPFHQRLQSRGKENSMHSWHEMLQLNMLRGMYCTNYRL